MNCWSLFSHRRPTPAVHCVACRLGASIVATHDVLPIFPVLVGTSRCCSRSASSFVPMLPARAPFLPSNSPPLVPAYVRLTTRLREALVALGFATSGEVASRLAPRLGMQVAPTTLLRRVRAIPVASSGKVRVLGVDDFCATRKVAYVAVRTLERRILPGVLPPVLYQAE